MNPISFTRSVILGNTVTTLTMAFRGSRKTRKPADKPTRTEIECRDIPDQTKLTSFKGPVDSPLTSFQVQETVQSYAGLLADIPILVVDDNPIHQQIAARLLESAGATVTLACNGEQAVLLLGREQYDLIIMDLLMPVMDGYAATRYIRNHLRLDTPVLALSADPTPGRRTRCLQAGMNDYMLKPFELSDLFERITGLLRLPVQQTAI
jgi:CheY-like chemotaxis protein